LLAAHEVGHVVAASVVGLKATRPMFVPFLGAVISLRRPPVNAKMEANIAIAGPAAGTISGLICLAFYLWTDSTLLLVLAYTACLLNLFNLIPCDPLDGGKIASAISPHMWWLGSISTGLLYFYTHNLFVLIILLVSLLRIWRDDRNEYSKHYFSLSMTQRLNVAWWYFGLLIVLGLMTLYVVELL
jgi:Zn-dependent protease